MSLFIIFSVLAAEFATIIMVASLPRSPRLRAQMTRRLAGGATAISFFATYWLVGESDRLGPGQLAPGLLPVTLIFAINAFAWLKLRQQYDRLYELPRAH